MPSRKKATARKTSSARNVKATLEQSASADTSSRNTSTSWKMYARNPRLWVGVGVVVIAVVLYFYKGLFIAATVNGQPVSRLAVISSLEKQSGKQALDNLIVENLVTQEANRRHIVVSQTDIDNQIKTIESQLKGQGVTLDDALSARGMSRGDLQDQLKVQAYLNKMVGQVAVSDADVQKYMDQNQDSLPKDLSDADLRKQVKQQLEQQAQQDKIQALVSDLQKKAKINYFVNY